MEKIAENNKAIFYTNEFCNIKDDEFKIIITERKDNKFKEFVLLRNGKPIYSSQNVENLYCRIDILKSVK